MYVEKNLGFSVLFKKKTVGSDASVSPGGASFFVQMVKPEKQSVVLFVSPQAVRILLPFTEEVLAEWNFSQLASYLLAPGGLVTLSVARTRLSEPTWALIRSQGAKGGSCEFVFSSPLQHKDIYETMEKCWQENKELHDRLFQEVVTSAALSASMSSIGDPKARGGGTAGTPPSSSKSGLKAKRMSLGFTKTSSAEQDSIMPLKPASKDDDALLLAASQRSDKKMSLGETAGHSITPLPRAKKPSADDGPAAVPMRQKSGTFSFFSRKSTTFSKPEEGGFPGLPLKVVTDQHVTPPKKGQ